VGDYLSDSTLNGVFDSANVATDRHHKSVRFLTVKTFFLTVVILCSRLDFHGIMFLSAQRVILALVTAAAFISNAHAATIHFVTTDLPDVTPGEDLWSYEYTVTGRSFLQSEFFDIYFDPALYGTLAPGPPLNAGWDTRILQQPNPVNLPPFDRGIFDSFALVDNPSLAAAFSVSFVYLGTGSPGSQPFEIFAANSNLLESGLTSPAAGAIPEPSSIVLCLLGLAAFGVKFYRNI
jgi:hypothetical protein